MNTYRLASQLVNHSFNYSGTHSVAHPVTGLSESDQNQIKEIFLNASLRQENPSLFNWLDLKNIEAELHQGYFYLYMNSDSKINAFIDFRQTEFEVEIIALATAPDLVRQNFMFNLLTQFLLFCGKNNQTVFLEVHELNIQALQIYKKCGFTTIRTRENYYNDGRSAHVMQYKADCL